MAKKKRDRLQEVIENCESQLCEALEFSVQYLEIEYEHREGKRRDLSPIEKMFAYVFFTEYHYFGDWYMYWEWMSTLENTDIKLVFSPKITGKSGKFYYPDFIFEIINTSSRTKVYDNMKMLIELDGHVWHEKTPEQVEKDKQRERDLINNGYTFYRYSGREIYKDPEKIVRECVNAYLERIENGKK